MPYGATHKSSFLITINTNRSVSSDIDRDVLSSMMRPILHRLLDDRNIPLMLKFRDGTRDNGLIRGVDSEFAIEVGGKQRRLHAHILTNIYHNTKIHIDPLYIREEVTDQLNDALAAAGEPRLRGKVYVNVRHVKGDWAVTKYVRKTGAIQAL